MAVTMGYRMEPVTAQRPTVWTAGLFRSQRIPMRWRGGIGMLSYRCSERRGFNRQPEQVL